MAQGTVFEDAANANQVQMVRTMTPNHFPQRRPPTGQQPPNLAGGVLLNKIPDAIPWETMRFFCMRVLYDGKPIIVVLEPQHTDDVDEAISLFRLLLAMMVPKPGPLDWDTVPENVRRHFRVVGKPDSASQPPPA
jgi:hypothetical protein